MREVDEWGREQPGAPGREEGVELRAGDEARGGGEGGVHDVVAGWFCPWRAGGRGILGKWYVARYGGNTHSERERPDGWSSRVVICSRCGREYMSASPRLVYATNAYESNESLKTVGSPQ